MNCQFCGSPLSPDGKCTQCQPYAANSVLYGSLDQGKPAVEVPEPAPAMGTMGVLLILGTFVVSGFVTFWKVSVEKTAAEHESFTAGYMVGTFIGMQFWPFLIAYLIAGRVKVRNWKKFSVTYAIVAACCMGLLAKQNLIQHVDSTQNDAKQSELKKAVDLAHRTDTTGMTGPEAYGAQFIRTVLLRREAYQKNVALCTPRIHDVFSSKSFANKASMLENQRVLLDCTKLDFDYMAQLQNLYKGVPDDIATQPWPEGTKQSFLKGFQGTSQQILQQLENQDKLEHLWVDSGNDLFQYAIEHANEFNFTNGKLAIANPTVRDEYNQRVRRTNELHTNFTKVHSQLKDDRQKMMQDSGVTNEDLKIKH